MPQLRPKVSTNELANLPHHDGQVVLDVMRDDFTVQVKYERGLYQVWGAICRGGLPQYTRLATARKSAKDARDLAASLWREGEQFNTIRPAG